jgi:hypothetical protein
MAPAQVPEGCDPELVGEPRPTIVISGVTLAAAVIFVEGISVGLAVAFALRATLAGAVVVFRAASGTVRQL